MNDSGDIRNERLAGNSAYRAIVMGIEIAVMVQRYYDREKQCQVNYRDITYQLRHNTNLIHITLLLYIILI